MIKEAVKSGELTSLDSVESPLSKTILAHHGVQTFEMNGNWICTSQSWSCPCCRRSKFEISRVGSFGQVLAKLVGHHDHMGDAMQIAFHAAFEKAGTTVAQVEGLRLVERMGRAFSAYDEILVCEDCNNADTAASRLAGAKVHFSFSPAQMQGFIDVAPHRPHELRVTEVIAAWKSAEAAYELRIRLINDVAHAAATDSHWFEPSEGAARRNPLLGIRLDTDDRRMLQCVSAVEIVAALRSPTPVSKPNLSRWRTETQKVGKAIPNNFLAMLSSEEVHARLWAEVDDTWNCPICLRSKRDTVYVGDKGRILFRTNCARRYGHWTGVPYFCNHCNGTLMSLKGEINDLIETRLEDSYSFVTPDELAKIIVGRPHSPHLIKKQEAEMLVRRIVERQASEGH